jgi:hypothetical protein
MALYSDHIAGLYLPRGFDWSIIYFYAVAPDLLTGK